ncbi:MAG: squalene/phytoene synthase family protein [Proteobacteria bacterium]|nr:squalene/phytoene synthase family protein [Pseudomonadota bacterium]
MNDSIVALVRRADPDRFLTSLFAPAARRDALLVLYAFNHELARAREVASEPALALIRLQWWREVLEGAHRSHEVATPLSQAIRAGQLDPTLLLPLIEAREQEAYADFATKAAWRDWLLQGAGGLAVAAAAALGAADPECCRFYGAAYGVAGVLRSSAALAAQHRCLLPADVLARHDLVPEAYTADPHGPAALAVQRELVASGMGLLALAMPVPREAVPAALPAVLARRDFVRWPVVPGPRGISDRLAVTWAGLTGRLLGTASRAVVSTGDERQAVSSGS